MVVSEICVSMPLACTSGVRGGIWEVLFLLTDNTGRSSWSVSLAQRPLCSPRRLSEDLIIHERLKSFQFIKHLSSNSHVGSMKNTVLYCFIKVNRLHIIFFLSEGILSTLVGLEMHTWLTLADCLDRINEELWCLHTLFSQKNCTYAIFYLQHAVSIEPYWRSNIVKVY